MVETVWWLRQKGRNKTVGDLQQSELFSSASPTQKIPVTQKYNCLPLFGGQNISPVLCLVPDRDSADAAGQMHLDALFF